MSKQHTTGALIAAAGLLCGWAALENTALLTVRHAVLPLAGFPRTAVIADLHKRRFGADNSQLAAKIAAEKPELIVIAGDLVSRTERDFSSIGRMLSALTKIAPVYAAMGNHEVDLPPSVCERYRRVLTENGVTLLENAWATVGSWNFAGLCLPRRYYRGGGLLGFSAKTACTAETLHTLLGGCKKNTVLLAHNPLFFSAYAEWGAKLTLSGHVHGGAVRLPVIGGVLSPERRFFPRYDKGLFAAGDRYMEVSAGLGKLRLFNPPEIVILEAGA